MPDVLLVFAICALFIIGLFFTLYTFIESDYSFAVVPCLVWMLFVFSVFWLRSTRDVPFRVLEEKSFPIENITLPDGATVQVISISPLEKVNITEDFKRLFPEGTIVKRVRESHWSNGIYFVDRPEWRNTIVLPEKK
jgi:hypothetical protein